MIIFFSVFGFFFISIFATITNYIYEVYNYSRFTKVILSLEEGIWSKISVNFFPTILWTMVTLPVLGTKNLFFLALILNLFVTSAVIYVIKYGIYGLFQKESNTINLISVYCGVFVGQVLSYLMLVMSNSNLNIYIAIGETLFCLIVYILLVQFPPKNYFFSGITKED